MFTAESRLDPPSRKAECCPQGLTPSSRARGPRLRTSGLNPREPSGISKQDPHCRISVLSAFGLQHVITSIDYCLMFPCYLLDYRRCYSRSGPINCFT